MFSSGSELWEVGDRHGLWERWDAGMWETRSFLAWVGFTVLHVLGRTEPAPLDLMPPNSHLPTDIAVGTTAVLLPIIVWV